MHQSAKRFDYSTMTVHNRYASKRGHKNSFCSLKLSRNTHCIDITHSLTNSVDRQLAQWRVVAALGEFRAVPDQELLPRLKWFDGVEVDVQTVLAGNKVLLLHSAGWVDVAHPVAAFLVQTIQDVV